MNRYFLIVAAALLSACGGDGVGLDDIAGRYSLRTVNGANLPGLLSSNAGVSVEAQSGSIRLNTDFSFSTSLSLRIFDANTSLMETDVDFGTFTRTGAALVFTFSQGEVETGTLDGQRLSMISEGVTLVFEK